MLRVLLLAVFACVCLAEEEDPANLVAVNFNCGTLIPLNMTEEDVSTDDAVVISVSPVKYNPSQQVIVTISLESESLFNSFMVQAREPEGKWPIGSFLPGDDVRLNNCDGNRTRYDTVLVKAHTRGTKALEFYFVQIKWQAPDRSSKVKDVEFDVTVVTEDDDGEVKKFWMGNSMVVTKNDVHPPRAEEEEGSMHNPASESESETRHEIPDETGEVIPQDEGPEGTGEDPNEPEVRAAADREETLFHDMAHDGRSEAQLQQEMEEKKERELAEELNASEGEWTAAEAREKAEHDRMMHEEMILHERNMEAEERERQERMRLEILDKENYERERGEEERRRKEEEERRKEEEERRREEEERRRKEEEELEKIDKELEDVEKDLEGKGVNEVDINIVQDGKKTAGASGVVSAFSVVCLSILLTYFL